MSTLKTVHFLGKQLGENATTPHDLYGYFVDDVTVCYGEHLFVPNMDAEIAVCIAWDNNGLVPKKLHSKIPFECPEWMSTKQAYEHSEILSTFRRADNTSSKKARKLLEFPEFKLAALLRMISLSPHFGRGRNSENIICFVRFLCNNGNLTSPMRIDLRNRFLAWLEDGNDAADQLAPFTEPQLRTFVPYTGHRRY